MTDRKHPTKPIALPVVDVKALQTPTAKALLCSAAAIRLCITDDEGTKSEVEFVIAGRTADDCNRAMREFKSWEGYALAPSAMRDVVIMQQSCVVLDDEL